QDVQTFIRDTTGALPIQRLGNVSEATLYGADLTATWYPEVVDGLSLSAAIGLLNTELGAFESGGGAVPAGNQLPDAPELSGTLGASYEMDLTPDWSMKLQTEARYS